MCAISGMIALPAGAETVQNMLATMRRRGPDDAGCFQEGEATLLHTRLAIIDPQGGQQPMTLTWEQKTYVLVYNGELYNTQELRQALLAAGPSFTGHSETEVLLHANAQ